MTAQHKKDGGSKSTLPPSSFSRQASKSPKESYGQYLTKFACSLAALAMTLALTSAPLRSASHPAPQTNRSPRELAWASWRDLSNDRFTEYVEKYRNKNYIMTDVDAYPVGDHFEYSMVWEENRDNRAWAEERNISSSDYHARWEDYRSRGYRPTDVAAYSNGGSPLFAGIWVQNLENIDWTSQRGLSATEYATEVQEKKRQGMRLIDMEVYQTPAGRHYAVIWYRNNDNLDWEHSWDLSREAYQQRADELGARGFRIVDFESYQVNGTQRYAAIWQKKGEHEGYQVRSDRTELDYANQWRLYRDLGYRLIDFERYQTAAGPRYATVWVENNARLSYAKKGDIDTAVENYRNTNNVPGISVAVIRNGEMLYRRGFGWADVAGRKQAHGGTVYLAASVSKVIGGTLAVKLEDEGRLTDGTAVSLNLNDLTRDHIPNMQADHTHTVAQLTAHLGCIWHYSGPEPPAGHYATAMAAAITLRNQAPLTGCTIGQDRNYSTHGFTFVGAVLEDVTGRSIARLIKEEIVQQYDLESMNVQFATDALTPNYERAVPYVGDAVSSYHDNSWKVLGGGIEVSTVDLARFGWKVLHGDIVRSAARDNRLWTRVSSNHKTGIAWEIKTISGRRVAEHDGSWDGARSYLRVYRDEGLVIAVMSNEKHHNPRTLVSSVAGIVLAP
jgi:CubicO group peptidase (beta-lactamase class C family)